MLITYLGHAGFCVETAEAIVIMDPWLSPHGAFDSSWFQLPCNHHLAALLQEKLHDRGKERFIYVSHEHKDHFDLPLLRSLDSRDFTFVAPKYQRPALREILAELPSRGVIACEHGQTLPIPGGEIRLFLDDSGLNRDSAIVVRSEGQCFANLNDCKLHDRLPELRDQLGVIDVFAAQFSGATWHPVCYQYDAVTYDRISAKKVLSKFEATAKAIETLKPRVYLPSAGPACFLDPMLFDINFERVNIFPNVFKLLPWLERRLAKSHRPFIPALMPGDVLDAARGDMAYETPDRLTAESVDDYLRDYARRFDGLFRSRRLQYTGADLKTLRARLKENLEHKLAHFRLSERIQRPLFVQFSDAPEILLEVDFASRAVRAVAEVPAVRDFYRMTAPSWEIARVLDGKLLWEDFSLTFRMKLNREPDVYQTLMQGFLIMEAEDLNQLCAHMLEIEHSTERVTIEAAGCRYSINRRCPHQGADLSGGWVEEDRFLVCPRHRWRFDLKRGGACEMSADSINAVPLEED